MSWSQTAPGEWSMRVPSTSPDWPGGDFLLQVYSESALEMDGSPSDTGPYIYFVDFRTPDGRGNDIADGREDSLYEAQMAAESLVPGGNLIFGRKDRHLEYDVPNSRNIWDSGLLMPRQAQFEPGDEVEVFSDDGYRDGWFGGYTVVDEEGYQVLVRQHGADDAEISYYDFDRVRFASKRAVQTSDDYLPEVDDFEEPDEQGTMFPWVTATQSPEEYLVDPDPDVNAEPTAETMFSWEADGDTDWMKSYAMRREADWDTPESLRSTFNKLWNEYQLARPGHGQTDEASESILDALRAMVDFGTAQGGGFADAVSDFPVSLRAKRASQTCGDTGPDGATCRLYPDHDGPHRGWSDGATSGEDQKIWRSASETVYEDDPMWPWDLQEPGAGAADVADTPTPGQEVADYPEQAVVTTEGRKTAVEVWYDTGGGLTPGEMSGGQAADMLRQIFVDPQYECHSCSNSGAAFTRTDTGPNSYEVSCDKCGSKDVQSLLFLPPGFGSKTASIWLQGGDEYTFEWEGVGEGYVRPNYVIEYRGGGAEEVQSGWQWDALVYEPVVFRGAGTADTPEAAKRLAEGWLQDNAGILNLGQKSAGFRDTGLCVNCGHEVEMMSVVGSNIAWWSKADYSQTCSATGYYEPHQVRAEIVGKKQAAEWSEPAGWTDGDDESGYDIFHAACGQWHSIPGTGVVTCPYNGDMFEIGLDQMDEEWPGELKDSEGWDRGNRIAAAEDDEDPGDDPEDDGTEDDIETEDELPEDGTEGELTLAEEVGADKDEGDPVDIDIEPKQSAFGDGEKAGYSGVAAQAFENGMYDARTGMPFHPPGDEDTRKAYEDGWQRERNSSQYKTTYEDYELPPTNARKTAYLFEPQDHFDNPPESWVVTKIADRRWGLFLKDGSGPLETYNTRYEAEEAKTSGFLYTLYQQEKDWYSGGQGHHAWKPFEQSRFFSLPNPYQSKLKTALDDAPDPRMWDDIPEWIKVGLECGFQGGYYQVAVAGDNQILAEFPSYDAAQDFAIQWGFENGGIVDTASKTAYDGTNEVECLSCGNIWYSPTTAIECPNCQSTRVRHKDRPTASRKTAEFAIVPGPSEPHCSLCGRKADPFTSDEGYTNCCNETICYGDSACVTLYPDDNPTVGEHFRDREAADAAIKGHFDYDEDW